jgi:hypothetical protein
MSGGTSILLVGCGCGCTTTGIEEGLVVDWSPLISSPKLASKLRELRPALRGDENGEVNGEAFLDMVRWETTTAGYGLRERKKCWFDLKSLFLA